MMKNPSFYDRFLVMEMDEYLRRLQRQGINNPYARAEFIRKMRALTPRNKKLARVVDQARRIWMRDRARARNETDDDRYRAHWRRAGRSGQRYIRLAHAHGIDPKHGLKDSDGSFADHMDRIGWIGDAEGFQHWENGRRGQYRKEGNLYFHPALKHPTVALDSDGGAESHETIYRRSTDRRREPDTHEFSIAGATPIVAHHADEITNVLNKDYGITPTRRHETDTYRGPPQSDEYSRVTLHFKTPGTPR